LNNKLRDLSLLKTTFVAAVIVVLLTVSLNFFSVYAMKARLAREKQIMANKVSTIMSRFNCTDPRIHQAIMETFDPVLVAILIAVESEYKTEAVSPVGCRGLMQLSPGKLTDWKNAPKNIQIGSQYLKQQVDRFGNLELAIAAYNAGPESIIRYQGIPPYPETQGFIGKARSLGFLVRKKFQGSQTKTNVKPGSLL
jgi:soluble lytic murein transglycosylase-like protein